MEVGQGPIGAVAPKKKNYVLERSKCFRVGFGNEIKNFIETDGFDDLRCPNCPFHVIVRNGREDHEPGRSSIRNAKNTGRKGRIINRSKVVSKCFRDKMRPHGTVTCEGLA
jgi:hypothetical protein